MNTILSLITNLLAFKIASLIFLLNIGIYSEKLVDFCDLNCRSIMCPYFRLPRNFSQCRAQPTLLNINKASQNSIVDIVNKIRDEIAAGKKKLQFRGGWETLPPAASMTVMQWDNTLEEAAKKKMMACTPNNLPTEAITFGIYQAMATHSYPLYRTLRGLEFSIKKLILKEAKKFDISLLKDYPTNEEYDFFTIFAHHSSLFIGCAEAKFKKSRGRMDGLYLVCYLAPSENKTHNMLYKEGEPCSACPFIPGGGSDCNYTYKNLCNRPSWPLSDSRMQNASILDGFKTETTTTSTTTTSPTTTSPTTISTTTTSTTTTSPTTTSTTTTSTTTTSPTTTSTTTTSPTTTSPTSTSTTTSSPTTTSPTTTSPTTTSTTTSTTTTTTEEETEETEPPPIIGEEETTTTTELTTTKSDKSGVDGYSGPPMLVPSCYLHMIICVCFLVRNIHME